MRDHSPLEAPAFNGLYARGKKENCPADHFVDALNIKIDGGQIESRDGMDLDISINAIKRMFLYRRANEVTRVLILNSSGQLYDSTNTVTPILTIASMTDFSAVVMYNRVYITPHNGVTGLPNEKVYVYDGTTARAAAGARTPEHPVMAVSNSTDTGKWEAGSHLFAVAFETASGFITKIGAFVQLVAVGEKKAALTSIPLGPVGTIARHIVATKVVDNFNEDWYNQEYYFVPEGTINDNVTTSLTVSAYDSDLFDSVDFTLDQLDEIPAGVGIGIYLDALITWGESDNPNIVRRSFAGEPEAFDEIEGYISITPNDGGGTVQNCLVLRDQLYIGKEFRWYATTDNGENPAFWSLSKIDSAFGVYPHSIAGIFEPGENIFFEQALIANPGGLWSFNGAFPQIPATFKIQDLWDRINKAYFKLVQVYFDPYKKKVYINIPLDSDTVCNHLLVADVTYGMDPDKIRWLGLWTFAGKEVTTILVDINSTTKKSVFKFGSANNNIYKQTEAKRNDYDSAMPSNVRFAYASAEEGENHFCAVKGRFNGSGNLDITLYSLDDVDTLAPSPIVLSSTKAFSQQRTFIFVSERCSAKLSVDAVNEWMKINSAKLYGNLLFEERPQ